MTETAVTVELQEPFLLCRSMVQRLGPTGPCSELHVRRGPGKSCVMKYRVYLEQDEDGVFVPLARLWQGVFLRAERVWKQGRTSGKLSKAI